MQLKASASQILNKCCHNKSYTGWVFLSVSMTIAETVSNCCCRKGKCKDEIRLNSVIVEILAVFCVNTFIGILT